MPAVENAIASKLADAPSHETVTWHAIDWRKALRNMRWRQARIVKAVQAGKWYKVRALQRFTHHLFDSRVLAVKRVTENQGKQTLGGDSEFWNTSQQKAQGSNASSNVSSKPNYSNADTFRSQTARRCARSVSYV